jgi:hypothetical protein
MLLKVRDKNVLLQLRRFGDIETVSSSFHVYAMELENNVIPDIIKIPGIITIEEDGYFEVQC